MSSDILGLIFQISADPSKALAAMAELDAATVAESGKISSVWSTAMSAVTGSTGIALGAVVGLAGGLLGLAMKAAEAGNQIYEASEKIGMSAQSLSGLMFIVRSTGGSKQVAQTCFPRSAAFGLGTFGLARGSKDR